jgi:hypothetical protein
LEEKRGANAKGKVQAKSGPHLRGLLVIQCFSLDHTVQSALVANLSRMIKTLKLENQSNKTQFQKT